MGDLSSTIYSNGIVAKGTEAFLKNTVRMDREYVVDIVRVSCIPDKMFLLAGEIMLPSLLITFPQTTPDLFGGTY